MSRISEITRISKSFESADTWEVAYNQYNGTIVKMTEGRYRLDTELTNESTYHGSLTFAQIAFNNLGYTKTIEKEGVTV